MRSLYLRIWLTVVAALLPMLFVSGMMGPYMSPIPANASAAMIFSFFVAVTVTPWLMLNVAGRAPAAAHADHAEGGKLGRIYAAVARPILDFFRMREQRGAKR